MAKIGCFLLDKFGNADGASRHKTPSSEFQQQKISSIFESKTFEMSKMSTRVYVGGLSHRARERDIERFFRKFGRIREISLKVNFKS
jgi:RNA recognition motif-containing protein